MKKNNIRVYSRLLQYSRPYLWRIILAIVASLGVAGSDVTLAKLVEPFIDKVIAAKDYSLVNLAPFIVVGLAVVKGMSRYVQEYFIKTAGLLIVQDIRNDLYSHSLSLSLGFFSRSSTGTLMSCVLNDVGMLQRSAADVLVEIIREGATLIGLAALAFYQDWQLALLAFSVLPLSILPAAVIGRRIKDNTRLSQGSLGNLTGVLQESFSGVKVIKAFGSEGVEKKRFFDENLRFYRFMRKALKYDSASAPVIEVLASLGVAAVVWYGLHHVLSGQTTQGELLSFVAAIGMMYGPLKKLTKINNNVQRAVGAAERVFEILDEKADIVDAPDAIDLDRVKGAVVFENVDFRYDSDPVLENFSINASPGEIVAIVGPSGAGKSTLVGLLARFYDPSAGKIYIDGVDLRLIAQKCLKSNIAYVDQETFLFNRSIAENIRYGKPDATDAEVAQAAKLAFADEFIGQTANGYETEIGDRGARLSGGQRQRLCIARALLKNAPLLILDEATSALDTESEAMVQKALLNLMENRTTFVIAHRLSTIMHADKIVVMAEGLIRQVGTHNDLLKQGGLYKRLYDMQFQD
ncbi:ABC transporter ATP-binding protein [Trichloromonas sp.]|uniref:ABC transporter ATP-binding protein n=1 Tax=Trichloromonas sp. TaxID=3069249 RepID=UPI003D815A90